MKNAMSEPLEPVRRHEQWARFRFRLVGPLLAAPPEPGQLQEQLPSLAAKKWRHPSTGQWVPFGFSTIEGWDYTARHEKRDPVQALRRQIRSDQGPHPAVGLKLPDLLLTQSRQHPGWSYQLHADKLAVWVEKDPALGPTPSYASVRRYRKDPGLIQRPRRGPVQSPGAQAAEHRLESREVRSSESQSGNALWPLDFHHGSVRVLLDNGQWVYPLLWGVLDDCSRLCGQAPWDLSEAAEELWHGLGQGFQKRALPRALMTDNGSALLAHETTEGWARLRVFHETILPYAAFQNGKQEPVWTQIEGRLLPMLQGVADLTLCQLHEATLAWGEMEYNRAEHSELGTTPLNRYLHDRAVGRPCPDSAARKRAFPAEIKRTQRRSDGTISLGGIRFEVPSRDGHFQQYALTGLPPAYLPKAPSNHDPDAP
jgi:putative transposase